MFTVFVLGNIASGKSTACRYLESRGAMLIDLDELAKSLYVPGSEIVNALAEEFGWDYRFDTKTGLSICSTEQFRPELEDSLLANSAPSAALVQKTY